MKSLFLLFGTMLCLQAAMAQTILITDGNWSVMRDPDGLPYGQGTGPAGVGDMAWTTLGFVENPNLWGPAKIVNSACLSNYGQSPASFCNTLSNPIWTKRIGCTVPNQIVYFRRKVTIPADEPCGYSLNVRADNSTFIYVNGQYIGSTIDNWAPGQTFNVPLVPGQNIIAVQAFDDGTTGWFSAVLCKFCTNQND
jgi:hypothetical protein